MLRSPTRTLARSFHAARCVRSHVGSAPIVFPESVSLSIDAGAIAVQGPLGRLLVKRFPFVEVDQTAPTPNLRQISLSVQDPAIKNQRAIWGLTRALLANAVVGVSTGYTSSLRLVGVGYRASVESFPTPANPAAQRLNLKLGFAHAVLVDVPADVQVSTPTTTTIELRGIDKQRLGELAARIRSWRVPEPYNAGQPLQRRLVLALIRFQL